MAEMRLELYVVGESPNSRVAVANLGRLCEARLAGRYELLIIDVLENPEAAEAANVVATPTLIKRAPPPVRWLVGDLSITAAVLEVLGIEGDDHEGGAR